MKIFNSYRINEREQAKKLLQKLDDSNHRVLVIHYSCESFYGKDGYIPRVTVIGILNKENNEIITFSLNLSAQVIKKYPLSNSNADLDEIEKHMLDGFSSYVKNHPNHLWVHWNMRSASYGFQAISNRYKILGGSEINVLDTNKIDLSEVFRKLYTGNFEEDAPKGKMLNLAERNKFILRHALTGKEEAEAFEQKDYLRLEMSTMRKVELISNLFLAEQRGKLLTNAKIFEIYDLSIPGVSNLVKESKVLSLFVAGGGMLIGKMIEFFVTSFFSKNTPSP